MHRLSRAPPPPRSSSAPEPVYNAAGERLDMDFQRQMVINHRRQAHEKWVSEHQSNTRFDHSQSQVRAEIIVNEARRMEWIHLEHQLEYAKALVRASKRNRTIGASDSTPPPKLSMRRNHNADYSMNGKALIHSPDCPHSPERMRDRSPEVPNKSKCACLQAPICRQITPKYRALALLRQTFDYDKCEEALETLRETYASDNDMLEDLIYRYGPEPEDVSPNTRLRCVEEKVADCDAKWQEIGRCVREEMRYRDAFPNVIRNLSIMRVFLEGSQSPAYGCDASERGRRDAFHQQVLDKLAMERSLFVTPQRERS